MSAVSSAAVLVTTAVFDGVRCLSVCPSVTLMYCIHTAEDIVKILYRPGSSVILVLTLNAGSQA